MKPIFIHLTGEQIEAFSTALKSAFRSFDDLKRMLRFQLNKRLEEIAGRGALNQVVFDLLDVAEAEGWLYDLLQAARRQNEGNAQLQSFEQSVGLAARDFDKSDLEAKIRKFDKFINLNTWLPKLTAIEKQVCSVQIDGKAMGTGFLVASDIVLTNYHVVESIIEKGNSNLISCRFDYKKLAENNGYTGEVYTLHQDWLIAHSPYSAADCHDSLSLPNNDELDYALLRLKQPLANRGCITLPSINEKINDSYQTNAPLFIVQHPEGKPIKLALDTESIIQLNENKTRLYYKTLTEPGSSGSPCFNSDWDLIALHHTGVEYIRNGGIPIPMLIQDWEKKGLLKDNLFI
jgi:hypothetical protein